jgi:hypothetical protein
MVPFAALRVTYGGYGKVGGTGTRPVPGEMDIEKGILRGSTMRAEGQRLVRPQSRGLKAGSDVSQIAALPCSHCVAR